MVFDKTWKRLSVNDSSDPADRLNTVMKVMADHPFVISSPDMARQVAGFRIRLLDLH